MGGRRPAQDAVRLDDVDHADVGHGRRDQAGQAAKAVVEVERGAQHRAGLQQEPEAVPCGLCLGQGLVEGK
jgi:hypothetical protein